MAVTGACAEVVYIAGPSEPDYEPATVADLAAALERETVVVPEGQLVDIDPRGNDQFGF